MAGFDLHEAEGGAIPRHNVQFPLGAAEIAAEDVQPQFLQGHRRQMFPAAAQPKMGGTKPMKAPPPPIP